MKVRELAKLLRTYGEQLRSLKAQEQAKAIEQLARVLDDLPQQSTVTKALKKRT